MECLYSIKNIILTNFMTEHNFKKCEHILEGSSNYPKEKNQSPMLIIPCTIYYI